MEASNHSKDSKAPRSMACTLPWPRCPVNQHGWLWDESTPVSWSWKASSASQGSVCTPSLHGAQKAVEALACYVMRARIGHSGPPIPGLSLCRTWLLGCWHSRAIPSSVSEPFLWSFLISPVSVHHFPLYDTRWINYSWISSPSNNSEKPISD